MSIAGPAGVALRRGLTARSLIMIGVGNAIGTGIFVLTGVAAAKYAGPAITLSYGGAALVCMLTALCYAELGTMFPEAGGSYAYALRAMGSFPAWLVAWAMVLEYMIAASTVAVGWSGYLGDLLRQFGIPLAAALGEAPYKVSAEGAASFQGSFNFPAMLVVLLCTLALTLDISRSAWINGAMVLVKLAVILLFVLVGAAYVDPANWRPFVPPNQGSFGAFGWSGVATAAGIAFFSYTGFEALSTAARETRNPSRDLPLALLASLGICAFLYIAVSLVLTGLADYQLLNSASPISTALRLAGDGRLDWLLWLVNVGTVIGLASAVLISLFGQSRVFYAMARQGQMPRLFGRLSARGVPAAGVWIVGGIAALVAGLFPLDLLGELVALGCLTAFASVCASTLILRGSMPDADRPFRIPFGPIIPAAGLLSCLGLMLSLPAATWLYFGAWSLAGLLLYRSRRAAPGGAGCDSETAVAEAGE